MLLWGRVYANQRVCADTDEYTAVPDERGGLRPDIHGQGLCAYLRTLLDLDERDARHLDHVWLYLGADIRPFVRHMTRPLLKATFEAVDAFFAVGHSYGDIADKVADSLREQRLGAGRVVDTSPPIRDPACAIRGP